MVKRAIWSGSGTSFGAHPMGICHLYPYTISKQYVENDKRILLVMSLLLGVCCIIRFLLLYQAVKAENYRVLEGICVKREKSPLTRNQQVLFRTSDGKEYRFSLEKHTRLLAGHSYRLYFKKENRLEEKAGDLLHTPALIGYEELTEVSAEE